MRTRDPTSAARFGNRAVLEVVKNTVRGVETAQCASGKPVGCRQDTVGCGTGVRGYFAAAMDSTVIFFAFWSATPETTTRLPANCTGAF